MAGSWAPFIFALLVLAAFTPSVGGMEPWVAWLVQRIGLRRTLAAGVAIGSCWLVRQGSVLAFGALADWHPLAAIPRFAAMNLFELTDFLSSNLLMPASALLVSVFVGWRLGTRIPEDELSGLSPASQRLLLFALRYLCPIGIAVVLYVGLRG